MSLILGNTVISGVTTPLNGSIAIGQIISSIIPLTDAGLHLLDGSVIQGGGIYNAFVQYIANLVNIYPQCFTDETTWQNTVNSKGVCGKFVYNSTNNTVRLPKITGFIEGTVDSNALGDLIEAGLPNITGEFAVKAQPKTPTGAFYTISTGGGSYDNSFTGNEVIGFKASISNSIYGNSSTVQPQSIKVFYYIVVATTTKTDIEVDIDEVITDLNGKANDADVVHKTGNETINGQKTFTSPINISQSDSWFNMLRMNSTNNPYIAGRSNTSITSLALCTIRNGYYYNIELHNNGNGTGYTTCPASDTNGSIVTTVNKSKSANGYFKLGNGLIIQWGRSSQRTITYPIPFSSDTSFSIVVNNQAGTDGYGRPDAVENLTKTSCMVSSLAGYPVRWLAIGY